MRAIVPVYRAHGTDVLHVAETCRAAGLEPFLVMQGSCSPVPGVWESLHLPGAVGKGGAVKVAIASLALDDEPFVVVDDDLYALDTMTVLWAAECAGRGLVGRPRYREGAGRLGRRLWPAVRALLPDTPLLLDLEHGGLIGPVQAYPHGQHALASPYDYAGWDLDVLLRHTAAGDGVTTFDGGRRLHRPSADPKHLEGNLRDLLDVTVGWVRW